jgi:hypothetical protein
MILGAKLASGAGADIFAWGEGQVVKLFKPGTSEGMAQYEAWVTANAFTAGAPAPEVLGLIDAEGRPGIVFPRYDGPTLASLMLGGQLSWPDGGAIMAGLYHRLHAGAYRTSLLTFRAWVAFCVGRLRAAGIPDDVLRKAQSVAERLPDSGPLCHGDLHASNIIMTAGGPRLVDWISALNADPMLDVARCHLTLTMLVPDADDHEPGRQADAAFMSEYARLADTTNDALADAMAPYMCVMAAMRMMESRSGDDEKRRLANFILSH